MTASGIAAIGKEFRSEYAAQRAAEGRAYDAASLAVLPYLTTGPLARQWRVRARSFDALVERILAPMAATREGSLDILDVGAGSGWLSYRLALAGHETVALDLRDDCVDGLGVAATYLQRNASLFTRVAATFDAIPLASKMFDVAVFNASIHYALDLGAVLREAARVVRSGGRIVILDSPFYANESDGVAMVVEKQQSGVARFGARAATLLAPQFVEFLTPERLAAAAPLAWRHHRVAYPLWYELRPVVARLRRRRAPSRFDLWECTVS